MPRCSGATAQYSPTSGRMRSAGPIAPPKPGSWRERPHRGHDAHHPHQLAAVAQADRPLAVGRLAQRLELPVAGRPSTPASPGAARRRPRAPHRRPPPTAGAPSAVPSRALAASRRRRYPVVGPVALQVDHHVRDRHVELLRAPARPSSSPASSTARAGASRSRSRRRRTRTAHPRSPAPGRCRPPPRAPGCRSPAGARSIRPAAAPPPRGPCPRRRTGTAAACSGPARRPAPRAPSGRARAQLIEQLASGHGLVGDHQDPPFGHGRTLAHDRDDRS